MCQCRCGERPNAYDERWWYGSRLLLSVVLDTWSESMDPADRPEATRPHSRTSRAAAAVVLTMALLACCCRQRGDLPSYTWSFLYSYISRVESTDRSVSCAINKWCAARLFSGEAGGGPARGRAPAPTWWCRPARAVGPRGSERNRCAVAVPPSRPAHTAPPIPPLLSQKSSSSAPTTHQTTLDSNHREIGRVLIDS